MTAAPSDRPYDAGYQPAPPDGTVSTGGSTSGPFDLYSPTAAPSMVADGEPDGNALGWRAPQAAAGPGQQFEVYSPSRLPGTSSPSGSRAAPSRPRVGPVEAVRLAAVNGSVFTGRASPSEYWWPLGMFIAGDVAALAAVISAAATGLPSSMIGGLFLGTMATWLVMLVPILSLTVRRLHDANFSGWASLFALIPYVGPFLLMGLLGRPSHPDADRFDTPGRGPADARPGRTRP